MKSITLRVTQGNGNLYVTYRGHKDQRDRAFVASAVQSLPKGRYRVRYTLDPYGDLAFGSGCSSYVMVPRLGWGYTVCFLTHLGGKEGDRLSRRVLPWV